MTTTNRNLTHATSSTTVADLLERLLDKGVVIAGDIRVKLVDIELLTIEVRLLICSVDKAVEMGLDWWRGNPAFDANARDGALPQPGNLAWGQQESIETRLARLEARLEQQPVSAPDATSLDPEAEARTTARSESTYPNSRRPTKQLNRGAAHAPRFC